MRCVLVSHFHWDREWYRTFEAYRARLVDAIDRVLDLLATDLGYRFVLDGQAVLLDDYLAVRPHRREEIARSLRDGRLAAGPWYVQPDSLLPSGESHIRNLLLGRRIVSAFGPASNVGYVPDSFGHPAQFPQLLNGFGMTSFIYWRGNGNEGDELGSRYRWIATDGSRVYATRLTEGYFNAACLPADVEEAARRLAEVAARLGDADGPVLLMNGFDHMLPDSHTGAVADALARITGSTVERGLLSDAVPDLPESAPTFRGELVGARYANLLAGVWSTRMPIKLRNRRCETLLDGWAEPWAAFGAILGTPDEQPALRSAWQTLLQNHAHDSICGCSIDAVADRVLARFAEVEGLTDSTVTRVLERIAGLGTERRAPWTDEPAIAVFNPSPHPRSDVVRVPLDPYPAMRLSVGVPEFAPLVLSSCERLGYTIDGRPVDVLASGDPVRVRWLDIQQPLDVAFVARDVPGFGYRRYRLKRGDHVQDRVDDGREIESDDLHVALTDAGTLSVRFGSHEYRGLLAIEDRGDRGDTYDFDPIDNDPGARLDSLICRRVRHPSGIQRLCVERVFSVPRALTDDRAQRTPERIQMTLATEVRIAPGVRRLDLTIRLDNTAVDHRVRLLFPTGRAVEWFSASSTFDAVARSTARHDDSRWVHPAPSTFAHQGWVSANGLMVAAPGLPEAEVTPDGVIAITLLRAVGWLARFDLRSRPIPAGPPMRADGAQMQEAIEAHLSLLAGDDPVDARDAELGLRGVIAGDATLLAEAASLLTITPRELVLSALKPAEDGDGMVVRVLNPTDHPLTADVELGFAVGSARAVRLDESSIAHAVTLDGQRVRFDVPAHALRSVRLTR